jgi:membrane associated rhomboid family serine protease
MWVSWGVSGASLASFFLMPRNVVSMGASGAVFGLFIVSICTKMKFDLRRLLEGAILGNFVSQQVMQVGEVPPHPSLCARIPTLVIAISMRSVIQSPVRSMFKHLSPMRSPGGL